MTLAAIVSAVQGNFIEPIEGVEALNEIADDWPHRGAGRSLLQGLLGVEALNEIADDWPHRGAGRSLLQDFWRSLRLPIWKHRFLQPEPSASSIVMMSPKR